MATPIINTNLGKVVAATGNIADDLSTLRPLLNEKVAKIDGFYPDMTVGQLYSKVGVTDKVPYNFRTSGGSADIGDRETDKIIGGTIAFNQLVQNGNFASTTGWTTSNSIISASDNILTITKGNGGGYGGIAYQRPSVSTTHKYLICCKAKGDGTHQASVGFRDTNFRGAGNSSKTTTSASFVELSLIASPVNNTDIFTLGAATSSDAEGTQASFKDVMMFDLTQMFGSAIADYIYGLEQAQAGDGVAWFKKLFPKPYYAYNAGQLMSVKTSAHKMTGVNQWDEEWEVGEIDTDTGENTNVGSCIRSKNKIPCLPNTTYFSKCSATIQVYYYDAAKQYIPLGGLFVSTNSTFTTPSNAYYMRFRTSSAYGTTYNNDICINLHWDGERDGEYEEYVEYDYPLDSDLELRGIPKLDANNNLYYDGDIYESDGTVTRNFISTSVPSKSSWTMQAAGIFRSNLDRVFGYTHNVFLGNYARYTSGYSTGSNISTLAAANDRAIFCNSGSATFFVSDSRYSTVDDFYNAIKDMELIYQTTAPTTESADPYTNPQIVSDWGTEEYVDTRDVAIPVGHETFYQANLRAKLEMVPNSPDGNGDYIVRQTSGENEYVDIASNSTISGLVTRVPVASGADGNYVLKASISGGVVTYSWVAE